MGAHDSGWGFERKSRMTPVEGAYYLGARNIAMVCYGDEPKQPFDQEAMAMDSMREVIWSIVGAGDSSGDPETLGHLDEILRIAEKYENITGAIFDDFFVGGRDNSYTPELLREVRSRLHNFAKRKLDLWVVLYDHELEKPVAEHIKEFDGITYWTWCGDNLSKFDDNLKKTLEITTGKRLLLGCYMYNYGQHKELSVDDMKYQLTRYAGLVRDKTAEGIILLTNSIADLGFEAVEYTKEWLKEHGDETL